MKEKKLNIAKPIYLEDFDIDSFDVDVESFIKGWNTYTYKSLRFSIQYPSDAAPSIQLNDAYNRLSGFGVLPGKYFEVRLQKDTVPEMGVNFGYLDTEVKSKDVMIGGVRGYKAVSTTGYGDAGHQGSPSVDFGVRYGGDVYHIIFYGDAEISKEEQKILASFKFLK
ncbi:hypothetical protein HY968_01990 [Candidatus Kaiserbacteria bacterium]|nr:hypothetical protein [Candidatus Kaiserbacteria bacterium]